MLLGIKKEYDSGKCTIVYLKKQGFLSSSFYEAKIYTSVPRKKLPSQEDVKKIANDIISLNWMLDKHNGYSHSAKHPDHPNLNIRIKPIQEPNLDKDNGAA